MVLSELPVSELPRLEAWRAKGSIEKVNGVDIFYIASRGFAPSSCSTKPRLLVIHGFPVSSYDFWKVLPSLQEKFEVFLWDFAGYGFSEKVYKPIQEQIDLLEALLQQKGYCTNENKLDVHIFSHDLGDTLAQELMARQLENSASCCYSIRSVVMLNGGILPDMHRPTLVQKLMLVPGINSVISYFFNINLFAKSVSKVFGPDTQPTNEELQEYYALAMCNGGEKLLCENIRYMTERQMHKERWVTALKDYAASNNLLLIDGPADPVSGKHLAEAVMEQVPGAKVVLLDDKIGHWPQVEAPDDTIKAFLDFHAEIKTF